MDLSTKNTSTALIPYSRSGALLSKSRQAFRCFAAVTLKMQSRVTFVFFSLFIVFSFFGFLLSARLPVLREASILFIVNDFRFKRYILFITFTEIFFGITIYGKIFTMTIYSASSLFSGMIFGYIRSLDSSFFGRTLPSALLLSVFGLSLLYLSGITYSYSLKVAGRKAFELTPLRMSSYLVFSYFFAFLIYFSLNLLIKFL